MRKGFSLMELMIVIIILGLLASLVMPNLLGSSEKAKQKLTCINMEGLSNAVEMFKAEFGNFPTMEEGLMSLVENPNEEKYKNYQTGGYVKSKGSLNDPWGNSYIYIQEDNGFDTVSLGADGQEGGENENKDIRFSECQQ